MKILITTKLNGVGLEADANILNARLTAMGHEVTIATVTSTVAESYDLGIALEIPSYYHKERCYRNVFIPNPEWFREEWIRDMSYYNEIWCKTRHGVNCFKWASKFMRGYFGEGSVRFLGWTSRDMYDPARDNDEFGLYEDRGRTILHVAGKSLLKNTELIKPTIKLFIHELEIPPFFRVITETPRSLDSGDLFAVQGWVRRGELRHKMNDSIIHLCPSAAEGWGHYIVEAMSTGAVVITTDAPPMNEIITPDRGILIPCKPGTVQAKYAGVEIRRMIPTPEAIRDGIIRAQANPQLGEAARKWYLENDAKFNESLKEAINAIIGNS